MAIVILIIVAVLFKLYPSTVPCLGSHCFISVFRHLPVLGPTYPTKRAPFLLTTAMTSSSQVLSNKDLRFRTVSVISTVALSVARWADRYT